MSPPSQSDPRRSSHRQLSLHSTLMEPAPPHADPSFAAALPLCGRAPVPYLLDALDFCTSPTPPRIAPSRSPGRRCCYLARQHSCCWHVALRATTAVPSLLHALHWGQPQPLVLPSAPLSPRRRALRGLRRNYAAPVSTRRCCYELLLSDHASVEWARLFRMHIAFSVEYLLDSQAHRSRFCFPHVLFITCSADGGTPPAETKPICTTTARNVDCWDKRY